MQTSPRPGIDRGVPWSPAWYWIGGIIFVLILAFLFFVFASGTLRHRYFRTPVPTGPAIGEPAPPAPTRPIEP